MPRAGKYFHLDEDTSREFGKWCDQRPWINQGALFNAILRWLMKQNITDLAHILEPWAVANQPTAEISVGPTAEEEIERLGAGPPSVVPRRKSARGRQRA